MRRAAFLPLSIVAALLSACTAPATTETAERTSLKHEIAVQLYDAILQQATAYRALARKKALAACIDWGIGSGGYIDVFFTSAYYEGEFSERSSPVTPGRLMNLALTDCARTRERAKLVCTCQEIDRNGRNVLTVPDLYTGELTARR